MLGWPEIIGILVVLLVLASALGAVVVLIYFLTQRSKATPPRILPQSPISSEGLARSPNDPNAPEAVVQRQLDAYNARDLDALLATYSDDAQQFEYPATLLVSGAVQNRERSAARLREPNLHAKLLQRMVMGNVVIDREEVTRTFPEGPGTLQVIAIYEVRDGKIVTARFLAGAKTMDLKTS